MMRRGVLTLVFDDGYRAVYDHVLPLLRAYGWRAVFAVPVETAATERSEWAPIMPLPTWKEACLREGHELAAHGVTHRALTTLSDSELDAELRESKRHTGASTLIYPGGAVDARVRRSAAEHFSAARGVAWGLETLPPADPFRLRTLNATTKNFRWWKYHPRELLAALTGKWVIETFHRVTDRPEFAHDVSLHDFQSHLATLARLPLRIATIRDVVHADRSA